MDLDKSVLVTVVFLFDLETAINGSIAVLQEVKLDYSFLGTLMKYRKN